MRKRALLCIFFLLLAGVLVSEEEPKASVLVVSIKGAIDEGLAAFVDRVINRALEENPDLIIYEIDTPGGSVTSLFHIADTIQLADHIPNCAFITDKAWSAGAFVAITCKQIYMKPRSSIGSALPVLVGPGAEVPQPVMEKYKSAFRAKFRAMAEKNGYSANLAAAMVDDNMEVLEVRINGERKFLTRQQLEDEKQGLGKKGQADIELVKTVSASGELLNLSAKEAREYGLATEILKSRSEVLEKLGLKDAEVTVARISWSEVLVRFISSPVVTAVLFAVGLLGIWLEFKIPGFGAPGIVAILCFALLFFGKYLAGLANVAEILLFVVGIGLLLVEIFVIPGFGITGISGILCIVVALILSLQRFVIPEAPWEFDVLVTNLITLVVGGGVSIILAFIIVLVLSPYLPRVPMFGRLVLQAQSTGAEHLKVQETEEKEKGRLAGLKGVAFTNLRPAGKMRVGDDFYDVTTRGEYIDSGSDVQIIKVEGNTIFVKETE